MTRNARLRATAPSPTPNHLPTSFLLLAQYGGRAFIPLEEVCRDFFAHLTPEGLARKAACRDVRLPVVRRHGSTYDPKREWAERARDKSLAGLAALLDRTRPAWRSSVVGTA